MNHRDHSKIRLRHRRKQILNLNTRKTETQTNFDSNFGTLLYNCLYFYTNKGSLIGLATFKGVFTDANEGLVASGNLYF